MNPPLQSELAGRVFGHLSNGTTDLADDVHVRPVDGYRDADLHERELRQVFVQSPTVVAHVDQFTRTGDFLTVEPHGVPVLLVRQSSGAISGYLNACRHRGGRLVNESRGTGSGDGFTCQWHGWRYDYSGALCAVPDRQRAFPDLDLSRRGLIPVATEVRHGLVWVSLSSNGADVATHLGALDGEFRDYSLENYLHLRSEHRTARFNWKLGIEAFLETYHFRWLHPAMKRYVFAPEISLLDEVGQHIRLIAPNKSILDTRDIAAGLRLIRPHATIAYVILPSTVVFMEKRHVSLMTMLPTAVDGCDVRFIHIVRDDTLRLRDTWEGNIGKFMDAVDEDFTMLESAQDGFGRPGALRVEAHRDVVFGRNESGLHVFRRNIDRLLAG